MRDGRRTREALCGCESVNMGREQGDLSAGGNIGAMLSASVSSW